METCVSRSDITVFLSGSFTTEMSQVMTEERKNAKENIVSYPADNILPRIWFSKGRYE